MAKTTNHGVAAASAPVQSYADPNAADGAGSTQIAELAAAAIARLQRDIESYHPNNPAIAFALTGETHAAIRHKWSQYPPDVQTALWTALQEAATSLLHQFHEWNARLVPANGYMYGLQDEIMKIEAQAEIALEEIHRIEVELRVLIAGDVLH